MNLPSLGKAGYVILIVLLVGVVALAFVYRNIQLDRGMSALKSQNYGEAMKALKPLAELGDSMPQYLLGQMFAFGWSAKRDDEQAMYWFRRAAMWYSGQGDKGAEAAYYVGERFAEQKNNADAVHWYRVAADGGSRQAAEVLAKAYEVGGLDLKPDPEQARSWREKAAKALPAKTP